MRFALQLTATKNDLVRHDNFTFSGRIRSIKFALEGILLVLKSQQNAWIHFVATASVVLGGLIFEITATQWAIIILAIAIVWVAEALNTAFELLCDVTNPEFHPVVKKAKDVSAGAVLISAVGAVIVGLIVFIPYVLRIFND